MIRFLPQQVLVLPYHFFAEDVVLLITPHQDSQSVPQAYNCHFLASESSSCSQSFQFKFPHGESNSDSLWKKEVSFNRSKLVTSSLNAYSIGEKMESQIESLTAVETEVPIGGKFLSEHTILQDKVNKSLKCEMYINIGVRI
ncbi:unnamed protein product [Phytomonas sp. EM1]|nr:unnamed protein product [Phytomonas sp. EM1]|eukprot:CCW59620.1 unnamed protein product [Phytomonas sp. isolate EM1]